VIDIVATAPSWVIVQTNAEERTEVDLRRAGYRAYVARYRRLTSPHGADRRQLTTMRPVFPGIVFVQDWRGWPKQQIGGEPRLMLAYRGSRPATLDDRDIDLIMRKERALEYDDIRYPAGSGPLLRDDLEFGGLVGFERFGERITGVLEELTDNGKAIVRSIFFGRDVRTTVDAETLDQI
jgi:hypothetical protein